MTVWNRTPGKAEGLGAQRAETVADAVAAAELIVLSLTHYDAMDEVLGAAQVFYQAMLALFLPLLLGYERALAIVDRSGSEIARFLPYAQRSPGSVGELYGAWAAMAEDGDPADPAYLRMMAAGARHVVVTSAAVGVDTVLAESVSSYWERAVGAPESTFQVFRG